MEGFVMLVNPQEKLAAVKINDGSYSVIQVCEEHNLNIGDYLTGDLQILGMQMIENHSAGESFMAYVQHAKGIVAAKTKFLIGMARG